VVRFRLRHLPPLAAALALALTPAAATASTHGRRAHAGSVCADADTRAIGAPVGAMRSAVVCLINQQRARHHLPALRANGQLDRSAQGWSNTMIRIRQFTHGSSFWLRISDVGYQWSSVGENIATGFSTPRQVVAGWMASTGHCQNILSPTFADVGTGVNTNRLGPYGPATWTQDFALAMGHHAPSHNSGPARGCPYRVS
jgi:uncharacterized protein YkwD